MQLLETELLAQETARMQAQVQGLSGLTALAGRLVQMPRIRTAAAAVASALGFLEVCHQSYHAQPSERTRNEAYEAAEELRLCALQLAKMASRFNVRSIPPLDSPAADVTSPPLTFQNVLVIVAHWPACKSLFWANFP